MLHHRSRHVIAKTMLKMEIQIVLNGITMKNGFKFGACETCAIYNKYRDPFSHVGGRALWLSCI